ncbi:MAG: hypothetical protein ABL911_09370 [Gallionella sp.]
MSIAITAVRISKDIDCLAQILGIGSSQLDAICMFFDVHLIYMRAFECLMVSQMQQAKTTRRSLLLYLQ